MIKLFSINRKNKIHKLTEIGDEFIIRDDNFISIKFGNGFDWLKHARSCVDCKSFLDSLFDNKSAFAWYLESENKTYLLDSSEFAKNDHFKNFFEHKISDQFSGVRLKIKKVDLSINILNYLRKKEELHERFEQCSELRDTISLIKSL